MIELDANVLTISGERRTRREQRDEGSFRIERASGAFARPLTLPSGVDADRIEASFADWRARGSDPQARTAQAAPRFDRGRAARHGRGSSQAPEPVVAA
jgi:hypothetical protein